METLDRINYIKNWILNYCKLMPKEPESLVVGVSGGIDSSVTSTICALTKKKNNSPFNAYKTNKGPARFKFKTSGMA